MHQRSIEAGLDDLDSCFSLGLVPDIVDDAYIDALKSRFTEVALSGDLAGLHELCEPVVRSGEIEWQTSPDLLLQLLDQGRLDIYRYVLDLASRTRDRSENQSEHWLSDISHDPLHMAIRLGHLEQVESFMQKGATFMGVYQSDEAAGGIVLTPLSAAAFWGQPEITRLILRHNVLAEGAQEAAVIALFNNDTEIMQILLSSGVTDPPVTLLAEETANSLADLNIADPQPFDMIQIGLNRTESDASTQECVQPLDVNMKSVVSISKSLQRPAKSLPKESIQPKGSRRRRHLLGRDLVTCMHNLCSQLRDICNSSVHDELQDLGNEYLYANGVWARGLGVFRGLMQDNPPSALVEAVDSLLVANAICLSLFKNDSSILIQFYNDLDRWRSVLPSSSRLLFDELAFGMWAFTPSGDTTSDLDVVNLPHFQELVQNLLSLEKRKESVPSRSSASGSRLSAIQREFETHETPQAATQGQAIPGRSPTRLDSYASSSTQRDDFLWADFVHMDRFEDTRGQSNTPPSLPNSWEDALSSTMMLLASVAFSIVLSFMIGLHGSMSRVFQTVAGTLPGYNRSCTLLADYLAMHDVSIASKLDSLQSELSSLVSPLRGQGSDAALTPVSSFSSLSTLGLRRNVSSSSVR
nr:ankyrin repeat protein [Colletotrichum truncatum]KAF6791523.1 ankyrin repeat protein [Colletotrichum truncatum]